MLSGSRVAMYIKPDNSTVNDTRKILTAPKLLLNRPEKPDPVDVNERLTHILVYDQNGKLYLKTLPRSDLLESWPPALLAAPLSTHP